MMARGLAGVTRVRWNILSNLAGNVWVGLMSFILIPVYIRFLGLEQYGLIGFFASLSTFILFFDAGLGRTLNRTLARLSVQPDGQQQMRDTVRSLEIPYWSGALAIGIAALLLSPRIGQDWFGHSSLSRSTLEQAVMLMGLAIAFQFPYTLYEGGLLGVHRQVLLNAITISLATIRGVGAVFILWLVSPTIQAFFLWQLVISLSLSVMSGTALWWTLPRPTRSSRFRFAIIRDLWRYAAGISVLGLESLILMQGPRLLVSRVVPLKQFGYFSVAIAATSVISLLSGPVSLAVFPRFSEMLELHQTDALAGLYHKSCQLVTLLIVPVATVIAVFSPQVLFAWTGNESVVHGSEWLLTLLTIGTAMQWIMFLPYNLQLADGWTRLPIYLALGMIVILLPATIYMTNEYGALGAAVAWVCVNAGYVAAGIPLMHRRLLRGQAHCWYVTDVGVGLVASLAPALFFRWSIAFGANRLVTLMELAAIGAGVLLAAAVAMPFTREEGWSRIRRYLPGILGPWTGIREPQ
jgi:O-antigen/teichoic acid export membrane protein